MRLAVLDDDKELCGQVAMLLRGAGHTVFEYHQGEALRRALRRESFDLLVMDWELPDISGVELLAWVTANLTPPPPVIMLTGRTGEEDIVKRLDVGADDYVTKALVASVLRARVEALLRRSYRAGDQPKIEEFGEHKFEPLTMSVTFHSDPIVLTAK